MARLSPGGLSPARLRLVLGGFFLALGMPAAVLVVHAYGQLKWEAFHQTRELAQALAGRMDDAVQDLVSRQDRLDFGEFQFLVVRGKNAANLVLPSELSRFPVRGDIPGLVGYFQVDAGGRFSTPLLPAESALIRDYGIDDAERVQRAALEDRILGILGGSGLARPGPQRQRAAAGKGEAASLDSVGERLASARDSHSDRPALAEAEPRKDSNARAARERMAGSKLKELKKQASQDSLAGSTGQALARVEDLNLQSPYPTAARSLAQGFQDKRDKKSPRRSRREQEQSAEMPAEEDAVPAGRAATPTAQRRITTFESELDPFELNRLDSGHLVLHRTAWRDGQRYTQGALIEHEPFMDAIVGQRFRNDPLARLGQVTVAWGAVVTEVFSQEYRRDITSFSRSVPAPTGRTLLYRTRMSAPAAQMELLFSVSRVTAGPGATVLAWATAVMALVLSGGLLLMYRLGLREIDLARQQQDFVAAVSHELRTPLTSIRMYGEMLREGWASEDKKRSYYDFIYNESERLSRLIANVLQLARMTRNDSQLELSSVTVGELMDSARSRISAQMESSGFELAVTLPESLAPRTVQANTDAFNQIMINLVDNAIKLSSHATTRRIDVTAASSSDGRRAVFGVRDHGPGVERDQMKKIFRLFYRSENELTRETVGTGIGLALVNRLARSMNAEVDVSNADPGARFSVSIPLRQGGT